MCLYTKYIVNPKYKPSKKNGYNPPKCTDMRTYYVPTKCGRCIECRQQRQREWIVRLSEELRENNNALFVTLTFDNKIIQEIKGIDENDKATKAMRLFLERCRKLTKKSPKHWCCTELGEENGRIHLHGIFWCEKELILKCWQYGYVYIGEYVNEKTIMYITKYMLKINEKRPEFKGKVLSSAGIGKGYLNRKDAKRNAFKEEETDETYKLRNGIKINLPNYYKNHIYTEEEKEKLWIIKQEKGYRYIQGEKVDMNSEEEIKNITEFYRARGVTLYKDNPEAWDKEKNYARYKRQQKYIREIKKSG